MALFRSMETFEAFRITAMALGEGGVVLTLEGSEPVQVSHAFMDCWEPYVGCYLHGDRCWTPDRLKAWEEVSE